MLARVRYQARLCGDAPMDNVAMWRVSPDCSFALLIIILSTAPSSLIVLSWTLYSVDTGTVVKQTSRKKAAVYSDCRAGSRVEAVLCELENWELYRFYSLALFPVLQADNDRRTWRMHSNR
jgi:hypothetical protein